MKYFKKNEGITLIALVITIIVMLILVGVTLSMISGENGILGKAERAVNETVVATAREETQLYVSEGVSEYYTNVYVEHDSTASGKNVAKFIEDGVPESGYDTASGNKITLADGIVTCLDKSGNVLYKQKLSEDGTLASIPEIPEGLKIGSTVTYSPSGTYSEWTNEHSGGDGSTCNYQYSLASGTEFSSKTEEQKASLRDMSITSWKVFSINESTGKVQLVPATATTNEVGLRGADGYNNSVKLLNDACSSLYGNSSKGITARSIKVEDFEKIFTELGTYSPPSQNEQEYTSCKTYPNIYEQEANRTINGTTTEGGLGLSDPATGWVSGTTTATTSIKPKQTYYDTSNYNTTKRYLGKYADLLLPSGSSTNYWVASRCVYLYSNRCGFDVRYVCSGDLDAYGMYDSGGSAHYCSCPLFPVVSLGSELIGMDSSGAFVVK